MAVEGVPILPLKLPKHCHPLKLPLKVVGFPFCDFGIAQGWDWEREKCVECWLFQPINVFTYQTDRLQDLITY